MTSIQSVLTASFQSAMAAAFGPEYSQADPSIRPSANPQFGDFQANAAMGLAKALGKAPRVIASEIVAKLDLSSIALQPEIAGPGFINIKLEPSFLERLAREAAADPSCGAIGDTGDGPVVVDYSSPNVAKEMHVGHLRSTIIGDAIARILKFAGQKVIRQNHLGDWGTQFGMLIEHISDLGWTPTGEHGIADLNQLYKDAKGKFDADPVFADRARKRVVALQAGDQPTVELWQLLIDESKVHFRDVYATLGVLLDDQDYRGESFYNPLLVPTVAELERIGLARMSEGAICAFPEGFLGPEGQAVPLILRKSDGGYGYDTTDMAAIRFRIQELKARRMIYVTDARQRQHFSMIFKAAEEASWLPRGVLAEHVFFGSVLGDDGKPFKSRSGETVKLSDLLVEAVNRAFELVSTKNPEMPEAERREIARVIGIGAVKYADLSNDRVKDYVFSWERMLAFDGNTAPYLQNAYVRIRSILRKAADEATASMDQAGRDLARELVAALDQSRALLAGEILVQEAAERALVLGILALPATAASAGQSLEPHRICTWLYDLATSYHQFYERCPVITAPDPATRRSRLALSALTARALAQGLDLLGIGVVSRM